MTIRKRNDSVKPGCGIDGTKGENFTEAFNSYDDYYQADYPGGVRGGSEGGHGYEHSQPGAYTDNDSGLTNVRDFQFTAGVRDITALVEENQDQDVSSSPHNRITAGVNRSQFEGNKDPRRYRRP